MKKFYLIAAIAASAFVACENDHDIDAGGPEPEAFEGVVLNELSGSKKYIELYNTTENDIVIYGAYLVKHDASKDGGKSTTWTAAENMTIPAKGYLLLESSDLSDPAESDSDPNYKYESKNHIFKGGLSGKKNVYIEFYDGKNNKLDEFKRGDEGAGWNQVSGFKNDKNHSFSRVPDGGEWAYADPTPKAANGTKVADIEQTPEN